MKKFIIGFLILVVFGLTLSVFWESFQKKSVNAANDSVGPRAYVNLQRLEKLAASDYKGPAFMVSVEEQQQFIEQEALNKQRAPASNKKADGE